MVWLGPQVCVRALHYHLPGNPLSATFAAGITTIAHGSFCATSAHIPLVLLWRGITYPILLMHIFEAPQFAGNPACIPANYAANSEIGVHIFICSTRRRFSEINIFILARLTTHKHEPAAADAAMVHRNNPDT